MDCGGDIVRLTYKQLKEMAEKNNTEEVADGVHRLTILVYLPAIRTTATYFLNSQLNSEVKCAYASGTRRAFPLAPLLDKPNTSLT